MKDVKHVYASLYSISVPCIAAYKISFACNFFARSNQKRFNIQVKRMFGENQTTLITQVSMVLRYKRKMDEELKNCPNNQIFLLYQIFLVIFRIKQEANSVK